MNAKKSCAYFTCRIARLNSIKARIILTAFFFLYLTAVSLSALEVKLTVKEAAGVSRKTGTVTSGIPFAKGGVTDTSKLSVSLKGKKIPAQFRQLAKWPDGSVRWALLDCIVDVEGNGKADLTLTDTGSSPRPKQPVKVTDSPDSVTISTGPLTAVISKKEFNLFKSITVDEKELVTGKGKGLVLYTAGKMETVTPVDSKGNKGRPYQKRAAGTALQAGAPETVKVEEAGPVKAVVLLRGKFPEVHNGLLGYSIRITAFAGAKFLKMRVWLENHGQHGYRTKKKAQPKEWFQFDGMAVELGLGLGSSIKAVCETAEANDSFKVYQDCKNAKTYPEPAYGYNLLEYRITSGKKELKKGKHTDGVVALSSGENKLVTAVRHFWQNYYKAIELDKTSLKLWLWPLEAQFPRAFFDHACPGYANNDIQPLRHQGLYNYPGSVHKGHEIILDLSGREPSETSAELSSPLFALGSAEYYTSTEAAPVMFTPPDVRTDDDECNAKLDSWMCMTKTAADPKNTSSIWHARTTHKSRGNAFKDGYWLGWLEFGDIPNPGSGYTSLGGGWLMIMCMQALRTGDLNFLRLADEMVRHRVEIDQQWSDRALEQYRGWQRAGYGFTQFHCARFTRAQPVMTGTDIYSLVFYYLLTGDPKVKEAIDRTAPRIAPAWENILASKDYYTRRIPGNMGAVSGTILNYLALHSLDGDKKWLDLSVKLFHRCVLPKAKSLGPHLHGRDQIRSQDYTRDDIRYCHAIHIFCLLHHWSKDRKVLDLLKAGADKDFPENYFDAPIFMADLHAYVALVTGQEDYKDDGVEHWIEAWPESKCPPVFQFNNVTWTSSKAMQMRTGHWLQYYFWKKKKN